MNTRDAYTSMPPTDAIVLADMIPEGTYLESAPPSEEYYSGPGPVRSVIPYESGSIAKLLAEVENSTGAGSFGFLDITDPLAPTTLEANMTGYPFIWTMFDEKLIVCTGDYTPQVYDGTSAVNIVATGPTNVMKLRGCVTFKGRVYYWVINEQAFWYAAAGAYQGALTQFFLDQVTSKGGRVEFLTTITRDGGEGADDLFVIVFNTGEVLIYQGDDPASANDWQMIGKFNIPRPCGARSWFRLGGRTLIRTIEGIVDLNEVLAGATYPMMGTKIETLLSFKNSGMSTDRNINDQIGMFDFVETGSLVFNNMSIGDKKDWKLNVDQYAPAIKKNSGAAWLFSGQCIPLTQFAETLRHSAIFQGRTYFAASSYIFVCAEGTGQTETMAQQWEPCASYGFSFSINPGTGNGSPLDAKSIITNYVSPSQVVNLSAFVAPFGGLSGQITMRQDTVGTIDDFWSGFPYPDKKRWYGTNLRGKAGGKR
jgi:hypothetical protein